MRRVVLDHATKTVPCDLEEVTLDTGLRCLQRDGRNIAVEGGGDSEVWIAWLLEIREKFPKTARIAHIGGGFCCLATILGDNYEHVIFELERKFAVYCPHYAMFVGGNWQATLEGTYDVVIYDIDDDPDRERIAPHLADGGILLTR